jgi:hypothetical protein
VFRIFGLGLICTIFFKTDELVELTWTSTFWYFMNNSIGVTGYCLL